MSLSNRISVQFSCLTRTQWCYNPCSCTTTENNSPFSAQEQVSSMHMQLHYPVVGLWKNVCVFASCFMYYSWAWTVKSYRSLFFKSYYNSVPFSNTSATVTSGNSVFLSAVARGLCSQLSINFDMRRLYGASCIILRPAGGVEHHWDGAGHEQVHRLGPAASVDPLRPSLRQHRALHAAGRLHAADHLPAVQRPLAHQSPAGRHWGMSAGYLQVRACRALSGLGWVKMFEGSWRFTEAASCFSDSEHIE